MYKEIESNLSRIGKVQFRRDLRTMKVCSKKEILLTKRNFHKIGPWNRGMLEIVFPEKIGDDFNSLKKEAIGKRISQPELGKIFSLTTANYRLGSLKYERV